MMRFGLFLIGLTILAPTAFADDDVSGAEDHTPLEAAQTSAQDSTEAQLQVRLARLTALDLEIKIADAEVTGLLAALTSSQSDTDRAKLHAAFEAASADLRDALSRFQTEIARLDDLDPREDAP